MIHAAISIRMRSQLYRYVRDVVTDTAGRGTQYYAYRGNARRKIELTKNNINHSRDTGLKKETNYDFKVNVNSGGETVYNISFSPQDPQQPITYFELINKLNSLSEDFKVIFDDIERDSEGIYFVAEGSQAGTSIVVSNGDTNDLFANLEHFVSIGNEIASDNFFDQTGAGKILGDLGSLETSLATADTFLSFPESAGATTRLVRESTESKGALITNSLARNQIESFQVVEIIKDVREGHVG